MGNLSNQFISKSYQSLIHLETDNTASSTLVGLQDGFGNSIGISVNTSGSLSISGSFTASLANGYAWVGDGNNRTSLVPTSSFGSVTSAITGSSLITASFSGNTLTFTKGNNTTFGVVIPDVSGSGPTDISALNAFTASQYTINSAIGASTSSLNSFTSSQDTKNSTLATYTGSVNTKFTTIGTQSGSWDNTALNSFTQSQDTKNTTLSGVTASLNTSASLAVYTASFSGNTLTFTKGNSSTFSVVLPDVSGSDISALNAFTQSQDTKNSTLATYTGSIDTKFSTIGTQSGSWDNTALNSFTQSVDTKFVAVGNSTASLNAYTQSNDTKWSNLASQSGSWVTSAITASSLITASFSGNTLTFTKGSGTTFNIVLPDVSGSDISSLNAFTQSQDTKNSTLATYTASVDTKFSTIGTQSGSWDNASLNAFTQSQETKNSTLATYTASVDTKFTAVGSSTASLNSYTSSQDTKNSTLSTYTASVDQKFSNIGSQSGSWDNTALNSFTQSVDTKFTAVGESTASLNSFTQSQDTKNSTLATYTGSNDTKWSNLGSQSGSFVTESETGSFARTNVDNNFSVNQTFTSITAVSASFTYLQTTFETSSVIYSSGSNQFGDELSDIQTLSGSVKIQGNLTINGTPVLTSSADISSLNAFTQSQETKNNTLGSYTASVDTKFTEVGYSTASLNSYTQSQDTKNSTLGTYTASVDTKFSTIGTQSGSWDNTALNSFTQSQETKNSTLATYTGSNDTKWNTLGGQTGSYVTSGITGSSLVTASVSLNTITFTKGDASTFNITVNTGSAVTTDISSLNSFTQSQETKNSTLATYTSSVDTKFSTIGTQSGSWDNTSLNSFTQSVDTKFIAVGESTASLNQATSSLFLSASLALVTASFDGGTRNLTFTKGNTTTFSVNIPDTSGSAGTTIYEVVYTGENITKGDPLYISGSQGANPIVFKADASNPAKMPVTFVSDETIGVSNTTNAIVLGLIEGIDLTGYVAGQTIYVAEGGGWSTSLPSGSNSITQLLGVVTKGGSGGKGLVLNPGPAQLPGLDNGYMWVGNGNNQPIEITSASFASSGSFNSYTSSTDNRLTNIELTTASLNTSVTNLNSYTQSNDTKWSTLGGLTGSYVTSAITGSSLVTASFSGNTLTFTKGDSSTFGVLIPDVSGSDISALNAFTQSQDTKNSTLATYTGSVDTKFIAVGESTSSLNAFTSSQLSINTGYNTFTSSQETKNSTLATYTGSVDTQFVSVGSSTSSLNSATASLFLSASLSLTTASLSGNTITFTKGDNSTFGFQIPDVSGSTIPAGTISGSEQITALGFVSSSVTGSSLITGSVSGNILTFTKGDGSGFSLTVETGSSVTSLPAGLLSSSVTNFVDYSASVDSRINGIVTGTGFATTGSNIFIGDQTITGSVNVSGGEHLFIKRSTTGANQLLRLGATDNENNFAFIVTGSDTNPGQQVWGINTAGGIWGNSFDAQVLFNSYVTASAGLHITTGSGGGLSAPLQNGYVWVGNGSDRNTTAPTSSFGGSTNTGSLMTTGSVSGNVLTFTKGDASTFTLTVETGSGGGGSIPTGTVSSSQQIIDYDIFAVKSGSNTFIGVQNFTGSAANANIVNLIGSSKMTLGGTTMPFNETGFFSMVAGDGVNNGGALQYQISNGGATFLCGDAPSGSIQSVGQTPITFENKTRSGSISFTNEGNTGEIRLSNATGSITLITPGEINLQSNVLKLKSADASFTTQIVNASGSLMLIAATNTTASAHIAQSSGNSQVNLIFKPNNNTGETIVSGSSNIFTNATTPTTGYTRYIGGSNNLYLNQTNGINSQITQSAASVSGNRPTMNNNIFNGTGNFSINQAVNGGTHTYSQNIIGGTGNTTINALGFTGSLNLNSNFNNNGTITINAASTSVAEIASGLSGSGTVSVLNNGIFGGVITATSPRTLLTTNTQTISNNLLAGGGITVTNISSSAAVSVQNNIVGGTMNYSNAGAAGLGLHRVAGNMSGNYGSLNLIVSASAISATNNISPTAMAVTNRMYSGSVIGSGSLAFANNQIQGGGNTYTVSGSWGGTGAGATMAANGVFGLSNTIFTNVEGRGNYTDFRGNLVGGSNLILTGSNNNTITANGGGYFGRYNANDGLRNGTGENIFVVGTGTSTERKTGFLIDSGSNTFVEGTLNVSGSTTLNGNSLITGSLTVSGSATITGSVSVSNVLSLAQLDPLPGGADGQLAVSASNLYFFSGSAWNKIAFG